MMCPRLDFILNRDRGSDQDAQRKDLTVLLDLADRRWNRSRWPQSRPPGGETPSWVSSCGWSLRSG